MFFIIAIALVTPSIVFAEGNPFVLTTDTMQTGLTSQIGGSDLDIAAQTLANMNDIVGAYYDSSLKRIVFIGKNEGTNPQLNKDDMAVAIKSIFFNNTMPSIDIENDPNDPSGPTAIVTYTGGINDTSLGDLMLDADYMLKQYAIGYDSNQTEITSTVQSYKSVVDRYVDLSENAIAGNESEFILSPQTTSLKVSSPENAFIFSNVNMQVTVQAVNQNNDPLWNQAAGEFANDITTNYSQYESESEELLEAKQMAKVVAILKWIIDYSIPTDMQWAVDYTPASINTPSTIQKISTPTGYSAQGGINYNTPNTYIPDDGSAVGLKTSAQSGSSSAEDVTWTFTNGGQQYQAVAVASTAFKSLGAFGTKDSDFLTPIAGDLSIEFQRKYSSFSDAQLGLGIGWDFMPARLYLNIFPESIGLILCNEDIYYEKLALDTSNGHETFTYTCSAGYTADEPSYHSILTQNTDDTYTVTSSDQTKYNFNENFELTTIQDQKGNSVTYSYDGSGRLTTISDANSHQLTLAYNSQNLILNVTDWANRSYEYAYDSTGRLTSVKDPRNNTTTYGYDSNSKLTTITDRVGNVVMSNTYSSDSRLATQTNASGITKTNSYDNVNKVITQTDNNGRVIKTTYDQNARITKQADPLNKNLLYTYGNENVPITQTDKNGNITAFTYDSRGNLLTVTFSDNTNITYTYNNENQITKSLDTRYGNPPKEINYTYDDNGNLLQKDEEGNLSNYTYNSVGEAITYSNSLSDVTTWSRDSFGNILTEDDPYGNRSNFTYDSLGRLIEQKDPNNKTTSYTYDSNGNLLTKNDGAGSTAFTYDNENRLNKTTLPNNNDIQYAYNSSGSIASVLDPLNNTTTYGYDSYQNLATQQNALSNTTTSAYDSLDRQTQSITPRGETTLWEYDANGNIAKLTDPNNNSKNYTYDSLNRLIGITYPNSTNVAYEYDLRGNLTKVIGPEGTSTYTYDQFDRLTQATDSYGQILKYTYDNNGNVTKITYPDNKQVIYTYDKNNRMLSVKDWNNKVTTYTYNANGTLATRTYPNGIVTTYSYDLANRLSQIEHKKGTSSKAKYVYVRDSLGRIVSETQSGGFVSLTSTASYSYDALGRIQQYQSTSGSRIGNGTYTYDSVGNILSKETDNDTRTYTYDADNRLISQTDPTFGLFNQYYDFNGNLRIKQDVNSNQILSYDFEDRLVNYSGDINFKYDGLGNRIARVDVGEIRYINDINQPLSRVLAEADEDNGIGMWYIYGLGIVSEGNEMHFFREYYLEDAMGNTRFTTNYNGTAVSYNYYDPFGNGTWHSGGNPAFKYDSQQEDGDTGFYYMRARYYDPSLQRFISRDPFPGILQEPISQSPYVFVLNDPINLSDPGGEYASPVLVGKLGELLSLIVKNTSRIPSITNTAKYRIPDQLLRDLRVLTEVKNVKNLSLSRQLVDFLVYSQKYNFRFEIFTRSNTKISKPLQELIDKGLIIHRTLP